MSGMDRRGKDFSQRAYDVVRSATESHEEFDLDLVPPRDVPNRYGRSPEELDETRARIADARRRAETGLIRNDPVGNRLKIEEDA